jgi:hypothetical protein
MVEASKPAGPSRTPEQQKAIAEFRKMFGETFVKALNHGVQRRYDDELVHLAAVSFKAELGEEYADRDDAFWHSYVLARADEARARVARAYGLESYQGVAPSPDGVVAVRHPTDMPLRRD